MDKAKTAAARRLAAAVEPALAEAVAESARTGATFRVELLTAELRLSASGLVDAATAARSSRCASPAGSGIRALLASSRRWASAAWRPSH